MIRGGVVIKPINNFLIATDIEKIIGYKKLNIYCGSELTIAKYLTIRIGYINDFTRQNLGKSEIIPTGVVAGCGINFDFIRFDFAYLPYGDLGKTYKASLALNYKK
jgi:hypothetical protein